MPDEEQSSRASQKASVVSRQPAMDGDDNGYAGDLACSGTGRSTETKRRLRLRQRPKQGRGRRPKDWNIRRDTGRYKTKTKTKTDIVTGTNKY